MKKALNGFTGKKALIDQPTKELLIDFQKIGPEWNLITVIQVSVRALRFLLCSFPSYLFTGLPFYCSAGFLVLPAMQPDNAVKLLFILLRFLRIECHLRDDRVVIGVSCRYAFDRHDQVIDRHCRIEDDQLFAELIQELDVRIGGLVLISG